MLKKLPRVLASQIYEDGPCFYEQRNDGRLLKIEGVKVSWKLNVQHWLEVVIRFLAILLDSKWMLIPALELGANIIAFDHASYEAKWSRIDPVKQRRYFVVSNF